MGLVAEEVVRKWSDFMRKVGAFTGVAGFNTVIRGWSCAEMMRF